MRYSQDAVENRISDLQENSPGASEKISALKEQLCALGDPLLSTLSRENPLARVKVLDGADDRGSRADLSKNRVDLNQHDGAGKLAHELTHLQIARMAEPFYEQIGKLAGEDPEQAEAKYYQLRSGMESSARMVENELQSKLTGAHPVVDNPARLAQEVAGNGRTYFENWRSEFKQLQANPKFRPSFQYSGANQIVQYGTYPGAHHILAASSHF